ncbi:MAG TPA: OmpA family protein [Verrucomicrobiae bacterium]|jgi:chemotaxis protein MotB|nr:OmpA family protein [Verrucomicrobiae bacterium]
MPPRHCAHHFKPAFVSFFLAASVLLPGCSSTQPRLARVNQEQASTIRALNEEIARLNHDLDSMSSTQRDDLAKAKAELEQSMKDELASGDLALSLQSRGLVVTVLDKILFDSGKAQLKESALSTLDKVSDTLSGKVEGNKIMIEGHTDNVPIRYSGWRSNWELSTARATEVIHYFVDVKGIDPRRVSAVGHGEFQPIAANEDPMGREKNRRVEIVISPQKVTP